MPRRARARQRRNRIERWSALPDAELLKWRFCELGLNTGNSILGPDIQHLYDTLERRGIGFRPHIWLSTDWFSPDGIPGIAVPFFAAHPRLARLERRMIGEAEGANRVWRRRILRHEAGHALDTAYGLRRRADWRAVFGRASKPYPSAYAVRPASHRFVQHLGHWYAQSHPTEDFAETFAVWLQPKARWRRDYEGWPALEKLDYVDDLMDQIAGRRPRNTNRSIIAPISENRRTLSEHYRRRASQTDANERRYDAWLKRAFAYRSARPHAMSAGVFLAGAESEIKRSILGKTRTGAYLFAHVASALRRRARDLDLVLRGSKRDAKATAIRLHRRVMTDLLQRNRERYLI